MGAAYYAIDQQFGFATMSAFGNAADCRPGARPVRNLDFRGAVDGHRPTHISFDSRPIKEVRVDIAPHG